MHYSSSHNHPLYLFLCRADLQALLTVLFFWGGIILLLGEPALAVGPIDELTQRYKVEGYLYYTGTGRPVNMVKALRFYRLAAERGDAEAQFILGGMLYKGKGTDPDRKEGFKWLVQAAEGGKTSPESMRIIGSMYLRGENVPQNFKEAKRWLVQAANQGDISAATDLAFLYYHGLDGEQELKKALELYTKAALRGDSLAQANVGMMHASGIGTEIDAALGYAWYSLAASQGNTAAIINRNNLMADMTWEELNRAQAISVELYQRMENIKKAGEQSFIPSLPE